MAKKDTAAAAEPVVEHSLSDADLAKAEKMFEHLRQMQAEVRTDPSTRPSFSAASSDEKATAKDIKRITRKGFITPPPTGLQSSAEREEKLSPYINLFPKGDIDNYSVTRWAMATERAMNTAEGSGALLRYAPWESQYYSALASYGKSFIDPATKAAMGDMVSGADGGYLAPEEWSTNFIDQIYPAMALSRFPVTRMPMNTRVSHMPKLTSAVTVSYSAENAALSNSNAQFSQLSFTARKQYVFIQISNELIRDSNPQAEAILRNNASRRIALDRDQQCIAGNGQGGTPVGLLNATNVTSNTLTTTSAPLYTELVTGMINVENLNGSTNVPVGQTACTGVFGAVALKQQIMNMKDSNGRPLYDFGLNQMRGAFPNSGGGQFDGLLGIPTWSFSNVLNEAVGSKHIVFGDWQHLVIMERQDVEILSSNVAGTAFQNDATWIRLIARYDVGVAHPEAFFTYSNG